MIKTILDEAKGLTGNVFSNTLAAFKRLGPVVGEAMVAADEFKKTMDRALSSDFKVGQRVQFYRKDSASETVTLSGSIESICPRTGWLTVLHRHGTAIVKPDEEKCNVLREKTSRVGLVDGHGRLDALETYGTLQEFTATKKV